MNSDITNQVYSTTLYLSTGLKYVWNANKIPSARYRWGSLFPMDPFHNHCSGTNSQIGPNLYMSSGCNYSESESIFLKIFSMIVLFPKYFKIER